MAEERVIDSKQIYDGRVVNLRVDTVALDDGRTYEREVIEHSGAVALVPMSEGGEVILVRQPRAGAGKSLLELPAGGLEPGEDRETCARRELQEEAGYLPGELTLLGGFYVAASYTTEYITIYLARDLQPSERVGDIDEQITVERLGFDDALAMAFTNEIEDSKTLIGLTWAARWLGKV